MDVYDNKLFKNRKTHRRRNRDFSSNETSVSARCASRYGKVVLRTFFSGSIKTVPPLVFKLFQINAVSIVFQRGRGKVYNADKFIKQLGQFVYQNSCHLRQFGWQLIVSINTVKLGLLLINFVVLIAYTKLKNDWFGSTTVAVRKTLSREARAPEKHLILEKKCLNGAFWMDSKNYWTRINCFSDRVTLSVQ